jgi:hypothetical protein
VGECHARETGSSSESCDDCDDSNATGGALHALIQPGQTRCSSAVLSHSGLTKV